MRKSMKILTMAGIMSVMMGATVYAGSWQRDDVGWWYQNDNGSYPANAWMWIDGNGDGVSECYYFNSNGYCLINNITPDGYVVNSDGAWIVNGQVQTQGSAQTQKKSFYTEEEAENLVIEYYYNQYPGTKDRYVIFSNETTKKGDNYYFIVRWQMSEEEVQRRMREGGDISANKYAGTAIFNRRTGEIEWKW
ncbi:hypothetical protein [Lacrimispora sp. 210928-DFI.3.58]|uniref:hypothetical protein n=1 Tax=Lacrimispora sp. 210928-DFI.3.58 TaxID=2883214 RepID=UPI001D070360|nr:hypothetical protein [Lacrimispora sp. 210928-DFI.3.58]MCB7317803.1 hypothetical protein [Lacrimispora sp. 210928-DFI.3.58]